MPGIPFDLNVWFVPVAPELKLTAAASPQELCDSDNLNVLVGTAKGQSTDDGSPTVNALAPFKGTSTNFLGASFKVNDSLELNASYSLSTFGDAIAAVPPANAAPFTDNKGSRVSIGTKISF